MNWNTFYKKNNISWRNHNVNLKLPIKSGTVLDIGCGTGEYAKYLHDKGFQVDAIDSSKEAISISKKENKGPFYIYLPAENIEDETLRKKYDLITDVKVLAFVKDKSKYIKTISKKTNKLFYIKAFSFHKKPQITINTREIEKILKKYFTIKKVITKCQKSIIVEYYCKK